MSAIEPPRVVEWLIERLLARARHGDSMLGDLAEGYRHVHDGAGRRGADAWYLRQAVSLLMYGGVCRPSDVGRSRAGRLGHLAHSVRTAARTIRRRPGFTLGVSGVLTVAIAATLAAFSVTAGTFDAARWWADEARSVVIWPEYPFSRGQLEVLRQEGSAFEVVGGVLRQPVMLAFGDRSASRGGVAISPELFHALRARPVLGRGLTIDDAVPGAEPVVVLGDALWRGVFGGARDVVGRVIEVSGVSRRVVGVMPAKAQHPGPGTEVWTPLVLDPRDPDFWPARELTVAGILRPGVSVVEGRDDVRRVLTGLALRFPFFFRPDFGRDATVVTSAERAWGAVAPPLLLLLSGTLLLLVVGAIDIGNLVLARSLERHTEFRVRLALGASRWQVVQQVLAEAALQAGIAGIAGGTLGSFVAHLVPELFPFGTEVVATSPADPGLVAVAMGVTLAAWALMGGIPTLHFLASTRRTMVPRRFTGSAARGLVVAQAALATVLLVSAALLLRSVQSLGRLPLGFDPAESFAVPVGPSVAPRSASDLDAVRSAVAAQVSAAPAAAAAGWISAVPLLDAPLTAPVNLEERPTEVAAAPIASRIVTDRGALGALGVRLVRGRGFSSGDDASAAPVALINQTLARSLWPDQEPVGRRIAVDPHGWNRWITVIGVVEDVRFHDLIFPVQPAFFLPRAQAFTPVMSLVIRSPDGATTHTLVIRSTLAELAPDMAAGLARPLVSVVRDAQGPARVLSVMLSALALLATGLGGVGLYGSLAAWVARRRTEIGTRLALGASPQHLSFGVLSTGLALTAAGVLVGCVGAALAGRMIHSLLFGVSPLDPLAFMVPASLLLATGAIAAAVPAVRAAAVPPAEALRGG